MGEYIVEILDGIHLLFVSIEKLAILVPVILVALFAREIHRSGKRRPEPKPVDRTVRADHEGRQTKNELRSESFAGLTYVNWEGRPALISASAAWVIPLRSDVWEPARPEEVEGSELSPKTFNAMFPGLPPLPASIVNSLQQRPRPTVSLKSKHVTQAQKIETLARLYASLQAPQNSWIQRSDRRLTELPDAPVLAKAVTHQIEMLRDPKFGELRGMPVVSKAGRGAWAFSKAFGGWEQIGPNELIDQGMLMNPKDFARRFPDLPNLPTEVLSD